MLSSRRFAYINGTKSALRLVVEPWADQYIIQPGQRVDVVVQGGPADGCVELEQIPGGFTIYGYEGCVIALLANGKELVPAAQE